MGVGRGGEVSINISISVAGQGRKWVSCDAADAPTWIHVIMSARCKQTKT